MIAQHPKASRRQLSSLLCEAWNWRQDNGHLRDMVCRTFMLKLHRSGHICLPEIRMLNNNPMVNRKRPEKLTDMDETPINCGLKELGALDIRVVSDTKDDALFNRLIETYHYLGYSRLVGETLKVMVFAHERPLACMGWCSAAHRLGLRDQHIGWDQQARVRNLPLIAYNTRFLISPWVKVPHLASHLLGRFVKLLPEQWQQRYGHPVVYLETFVQPDLYPGTCYRAANWISLGMTQGLGVKSKTSQPTVPPKELLVYPLHKNFRARLGN